MGGCASKSSVVGSERTSHQQQEPTGSSASIACKPQALSSCDVTTSPGSQLRAAAKTAWQTSARNLRMSLSRSRRRQESYRMRVRDSDNDNDHDSDDDVEEEELDSAGGGGRPGAPRSRARSPDAALLPVRCGSASQAQTSPTSVAWQAPGAEVQAAVNPSGRRAARFLPDSDKGDAARVGITTTASHRGAHAARSPGAGGTAVGAARRDDDDDDNEEEEARGGNGGGPRGSGGDSRVQSFHAGGQATRNLTDLYGNGGDLLPAADSPTFAGAGAEAGAAAAAAAAAAKRRSAAGASGKGAAAAAAAGGAYGGVGVGDAGDGSSCDGSPGSRIPYAPSPIGGPTGRDGPLPARAPRTSSPAAHEAAAQRRAPGPGPRASVGGEGGWTAPIVPSPGPFPPLGVGGVGAGPLGGAPGVMDPAAAAAAAVMGGGGAGGEAVQWVIRPGPPIETAYLLGDVLGKGSFGVVRAATHLASGAHVAVKTIRKSLLAASDVSALRREVEILHHLSGHPHISQLLGVYEEPAQLHLVMELYQGGDLFDAIIAVGRHSERAAADVMRTVLAAIAYCHAMGVAHRDIKPENFMLTAPAPGPTPDTRGGPLAGGQPPPQQQLDPVELLEAVESIGGETQPLTGGKAQQQSSQQQQQQQQQPSQQPEESLGGRLKLIDFGLSVFCSDAAPMTDTVGTSYYVAPEVLAKCYSRSADVWSAGVILHILLTGYAPFDGRNDQEILRAVQMSKLDLSTDPIWGSISRDAMMVLTAMLDRDPAKRATAEQLLAMPWLGRTAAACTASTAPLPGVVSERMRRFARMNSFKKEARRVVAGLMRPEEVAGLVAQFRSLDADGDGKLSVGELKDGLARQELQGRGSGAPAGGLKAAGAGGQAAGGAGRGPMGEDELRRLMERTDLDGDGQLDQSEFLGAALPTAAISRQAQQALAAARTAAHIVHPGAGGRGPAVPAAAATTGNPLAAAFAHFDADGSGFITADELRSALAGHHPTGQGPDVRALLSQVDRDDDGRISYPEFLEMMVQEVEDDELGELGEAHGNTNARPAGAAAAAAAAAAAGNRGGVQQQQQPPGVMRREGPFPGPAAQAGAGTGGRGGLHQQQQQQQQLLAQGRGADRSPAVRPQQKQAYDEDMVPYETLPMDPRCAPHCGGGGGTAARSRGANGGGRTAADKQRAAAWGAGRLGAGAPPPPGAAAAAAAVIRARREAAGVGPDPGGGGYVGTAAGAAAAQLAGGRPGQHPASSFVSNAAVQSYSGGVSSLDWSDECGSTRGSARGSARGGGGGGGGGEDAVGYDDAGHYVGRGAGGAAGAGNVPYVPSRLAPAPAGGLMRAAEAAALTLMSQGEDPDSLLQHISIGGTAAGPDGTSSPRNPKGSLAPRPAGAYRPVGQGPLVPQPAANRRARRHSAAEALEDCSYGSASRDGTAGVMADRSARVPRMSEGRASQLTHGTAQQRGNGGFGTGNGNQYSPQHHHHHHQQHQQPQQQRYQHHQGGTPDGGQYTAAASGAATRGFGTGAAAGAGTGGWRAHGAQQQPQEHARPHQVQMLVFPFRAPPAGAGRDGSSSSQGSSPSSPFPRGTAGSYAPVGGTPPAGSSPPGQQPLLPGRDSADAVLSGSSHKPSPQPPPSSSMRLAPQPPTEPYSPGASGGRRAAAPTCVRHLYPADAGAGELIPARSSPNAPQQQQPLQQQQPRGPGGRGGYGAAVAVGDLLMSSQPQQQYNVAARSPAAASRRVPYDDGLDGGNAVQGFGAVLPPGACDDDASAATSATAVSASGRLHLRPQPLQPLRGAAGAAASEPLPALRGVPPPLQQQQQQQPRAYQAAGLAGSWSESGGAGAGTGSRTRGGAGADGGTGQTGPKHWLPSCEEEDLVA